LDNIKGIRKERTADLKAEKERLEGLQREKAIADKLKGRIVDANSSLSTKEVEYNATVADHEQLVHKNSKFYELSHKFREVYQKVESLEKERERYKKERASAEDSMQEIPGTRCVDRICARLTVCIRSRHGRGTPGPLR
jgi:DNA repair protein RAD50